MLSKRKMEKVFGDEIVFLTGAAGGLGREIAREVSKYCRTLILIDINEQGLRDLQIELRRTTSCDVTHEVVDLSSRQSVEGFLGRFDDDMPFSGVLINNAGISTMGFVESLPEEELRKMMEVNFFAPINFIKFFLKAMMLRRKGRIITIASGSGILANYGGSGYCASKAAAVVYLEGLRQELAGMKVKSHTVLLPTVMTDFHQKVKDGEFGDMAKNLPTITPKQAARELLRQVVSGKEIIAFTPTLRIGLTLNGVAPSLLRMAMSINAFFLNHRRGRI